MVDVISFRFFIGYYYHYYGFSFFSVLPLK